MYVNIFIAYFLWHNNQYKISAACNDKHKHFAHGFVGQLGGTALCVVTSEHLLKILSWQ